MERGVWYSIPELASLATVMLVPDTDDMTRNASGEFTWNRQVKNAVRQFRREANPVEWNGERGTSRYRIPVNSTWGVNPLPTEEVILTDDDAAPSPTVSNDGNAAECYVQRQLQSEGWDVVNVRNRGLGYDLYALRYPEVSRVEVKSSTRGNVTPQLTEGEMLAARYYGESYVLATVDNWNGESGEISMYQDPANQMTITEVVRTFYRIER